MLFLVERFEVLSGCIIGVGDVDASAVRLVNCRTDCFWQHRRGQFLRRNHRQRADWGVLVVRDDLVVLACDLSGRLGLVFRRFESCLPAVQPGVV